MTTTDIRNVRRDLDDLDERSARLRQDIRKRAEATREDVTRRTEATREQLAALAGEMSEDLGERAVAARDALLERYHEIEEDLPTQEVAVKAQLSAWRALQAGLGGLLTLPALAVSALGSLSRLADDLSERGSDVSERSRELLATVPSSKAHRRRAKRRTAAVALLGFVAGAVAGWAVASRKRTQVTYEPPLPANWQSTSDAQTAPAAPATPEATSQAQVVDVRSEATAPELGRDA